MPLKLVEVMRENPGTCLICGGTPTEDGEILPSVHAEGLDVNWGDSVYFCYECSGMIADLIDRPSLKTWQSTNDAHEKLLEDFHTLEEEVKALREFKEKVIGGREAIREAKTTRKPATPRKRAA